MAKCILPITADKKSAVKSVVIVKMYSAKALLKNVCRMDRLKNTSGGAI